eukprot:SAG31_NODE_1079_length_10031_cov_5.270741_10_plen_1153_part_00
MLPWPDRTVLEEATHALRVESGIEAQIRRYWAVLTAAPRTAEHHKGFGNAADGSDPLSRTTEITETRYTDLHLRIGKVLCPLFDLDCARLVAAEDWAEDKKTPVAVQTSTNRENSGEQPEYVAASMAWPEFSASMFELADLWTQASPGTDADAAESYTGFLEWLFSRVTTTVGGEAGHCVLCALDEIVSAAAPTGGTSAISPVELADPYGAAWQLDQLAAAKSELRKAKLRAAVRRIPRPPLGRPRHHPTDDGNGNRKPVDFAGLRPTSGRRPMKPLVMAERQPQGVEAGVGSGEQVAVDLATAATVEQARLNHLEEVTVDDTVYDLLNMQAGPAPRASTDTTSVVPSQQQPNESSGGVEGMMPVAFSLTSLGPPVVASIGEAEMAVLNERREAAARFVTLRQRFVAAINHDRLERDAPGRAKRQKRWLDKLLRESQGFARNPANKLQKDPEGRWVQASGGKAEKVPLLPVSGAAATILFLREVLGMAAAWSVDPLSMLAVKEQGQLVLHTVCRMSTQAQIWLATLVNRPVPVNDDQIDQAMLAALTSLPGLELAAAAAIEIVVPKLGQLAIAFFSQQKAPQHHPGSLVQHLISELLREIVVEAKRQKLPWANDSLISKFDTTTTVGLPDSTAAIGLGPAPSHGLLSIVLTPTTGVHSARELRKGPKPLGGRKAQRQHLPVTSRAARANAYARRPSGIRQTYHASATPLEPQAYEPPEERPGVLPPPPPPKHPNKLAGMSCLRQQLPPGHIVKDRFVTRSSVDALMSHALALAAGPTMGRRAVVPQRPYKQQPLPSSDADADADAGRGALSAVTSQVVSLPSEPSGSETRITGIARDQVRFSEQKMDGEGLGLPSRPPESSRKNWPNPAPFEALANMSMLKPPAAPGSDRAAEPLAHDSSSANVIETNDGGGSNALLILDVTSTPRSNEMDRVLGRTRSSDQVKPSRRERSSERVRPRGQAKIVQLPPPREYTPRGKVPKVQHWSRRALPAQEVQLRSQSKKAAVDAMFAADEQPLSAPSVPGWGALDPNEPMGSRAIQATVSHFETLANVIETNDSGGSNALPPPPREYTPRGKNPKVQVPAQHWSRRALPAQEVQLRSQSKKAAVDAMFAADERPLSVSSVTGWGVSDPNEPMGSRAIQATVSQRPGLVS